MPTDQPTPARRCSAVYPSTSRDPNTRIVHCELPAGHGGDHEEVSTESSWPACCSGESFRGDPHGFHTDDCPVYLANVAAWEASRPRLDPNWWPPQLPKPLTQADVDAAYERGKAEQAAEVEQLRYERRLLGSARMTMDLIAAGTPDRWDGLRAEAERTAQAIVDEIGHPVTDEPALGPTLREELAAARAEVERLQVLLDHAEQYARDFQDGEGWDREEQWALSYTLNGTPQEPGSGGHVFDSRAEAQQAQRHIEAWQRHYPDLTYADVKYHRREILTGEWQPETETPDA
jgi:hypothetical protein